MNQIEQKSHEAPVAAPVKRKKKRTNKRPRVQPPYAVIVLNDDLHSFPYVIETFQKVFGYSAEKATMFAMVIHFAGRALVWSGTRELAELKLEQIRGAGPDIYASTRVEFPLGAYIEPLP